MNYGKQYISDEDVANVSETLKSDFLTQGPKVPEFENAISRYVGAAYSSAVSSATAGLHLGCLALGVGKGDIVWTSPNTFVSTANAALYCGATVDFVDIDPNTYNISVDCLKEKLVQAKKDNKLPKLVVPVHFAGQSCDMEAIWELSKEYKFKVVEDASHALGGKYKGEKIGNCKYSDMSVFSFHPVKMITTGEGGAVTTNSKSLDEKVSLLRTHGITKDPSQFNSKSHGDWYYEQQSLGYNYRLTDIQAALGISQLKRLDSFVLKRKQIAEFYLQNLDQKITPKQLSDTNSSWHLFVIQVSNRQKIFQRLKNSGIQPQIHYIPVNSQPFYNCKTLPNCEIFYEQCLSLPIYYDLTMEQCEQVVSCINHD